MPEIRPIKFRDDSPERMAARMIAMDALGAWNPVPHDKLTRLLAVAETLRGVVGYAPLTDSMFDAVLAVLAVNALAPEQACTLIDPLLGIWEGARAQVAAPPEPATPPDALAPPPMLPARLRRKEAP